MRARDVTLDAVGDINLGHGVADVMARAGFRFPWSGVAGELRTADVAFGNLECAVSTRGRKGAGKELNFGGRPAALREAARYAGMDVLNLANNHAGDYGSLALLDTIRFHWGVERMSRPSARQRMLARAALAGGAHAVIGAHPHVWSAASGPASRTGILRLRLSARGIEAVRFLRARISRARPALVGRGAAIPR